MSQDLIWTFIAFILTLLVFSYLLGDNPLFRLAVYIFAGVVSGYVVVLAVYQVLLPRLVLPLLRGSPTEQMLALVPLGLSLLMLGKLSPRFARLGNIPMAYLVGAGAAVIIGGAVLGTLVFQSAATLAVFQVTTAGASPGMRIFEGSVVLVGTLSALAYFHFGAGRHATEAGAQRSRPLELIARAGKFFIVITFGAVFAGVYAAALTALIDRLDFIKNVFLLILTLF
jgi:hypothetical protein